MAARNFGVSAVAATSLAAMVCLPTAFLAPSGSPNQVSAALRGTASFAEPQRQQASGSVAGTAAAVAVAAAVGATLVRRSRKQASQTSSSRRELAVAYEESGIDLIDNGKFAQGLVGAEGAWGRYEFDPVGFTKYTEFVPFLREAELKHGRTAMLAWLGLVVPDFVRIPGERMSFETVPRTIDAHDALSSAVGVDFQILFWIALVELCCAKKVFEWNSLEVAGDYGLTALFPQDEEGQKRMRVAELKNGRLAMIAFGGAVTQAVITGNKFPWLY